MLAGEDLLVLDRQRRNSAKDVLGPRRNLAEERPEKFEMNLCPYESRQAQSWMTEYMVFRDVFYLNQELSDTVVLQSRAKVSDRTFFLTLKLGKPNQKLNSFRNLY